MKHKSKILLGLGVTVALVGTAGVDSFASEVGSSTVKYISSYQGTGKFVQKVEYQTKTVYDSSTKKTRYYRVPVANYYFQSGNQLLPLAKNDADVVKKYGTSQSVTVYGKMVYESGKRVLDVDRVSQATTSYQGTGKFVQKRDYTRDYRTGKTYYKTNYYFQSGSQLYKLADNDIAVVRKYGFDSTLKVYGKVSYPDGQRVLDIDRVMKLSTAYQGTGHFVEKRDYTRDYRTGRTYYKTNYYFQSGNQLYKLADNSVAVAKKYGFSRTVTVFGELTENSGQRVLEIDRVR